MNLKGIIDEDFNQYKKPTMFLICPHCSFKCCIERGNDICQNSSLAKAKIIQIPTEDLVKRYLENFITSSITFGGLEPLDDFDDVIEFITLLRNKYNNNDDVVIYTGYNKDEVLDKIQLLSQFKNIIVKFGRFIPDDESRYDEVLGITLASHNQYAERIGE